MQLKQNQVLKIRNEVTQRAINTYLPYPSQSVLVDCATMLATNCLLLQFEYLKRTLFLEVKVDLSLGFWQAVSTSQTIDYRIILITVPSWITVHRSASPEQGKPSVKESARSRFFFAANRRGLTAGDFFTLFLSAMGNTSSKTATTNLSSKD